MIRARHNHTEACRSGLEELIGGDRVRRAEARRERTLDKRIQQEESRIGADGVLLAPAPAPGTPRSCTASDAVEDGPTNQSETLGVDERHGTATRRPADPAIENRSRKAARSTPQGDDSWRPNSVRYCGLPRGSTQAEYTAWMRANRGPMSYSPDNPPADDGDADGDGSTHEDLLILSAIGHGSRKFAANIGWTLERAST